MTRRTRGPWALGVGVLTLAAVRAALVLITVEGASMEPGYRHGDRRLMLRRPPVRLRHARVVVLRGPFGPPGEQSAHEVRYAVKRVAGLSGHPTPSGLPGAGRTIPPGRDGWPCWATTRLTAPTHVLCRLGGKGPVPAAEPLPG